ncbi:helix-turn-helix domain-containing protein [Runella slithyformis]|uniref:Helix-turn-helix domain protein n=1 Tax=Runella slithyformis (strain ATCC 29530 / DSM 19594 / LMG 11500 / NCIMB 11436 / LSU 4) TaxID=761193 RepID=A0A7U4E7T8_RUNSL|nr:helix-turn-helix domain-containing protein [Runella slithyformis]AEI50668.1 helix-turn-helix domain protein [Runella slithyformis DSM 19594]
MDLTKTIRTLRESKGLTQEDLADQLSVTRSNYAYLEGRGNKLTVEQLEKIAIALGVSVVELLTGEARKVVDSGEVEELKKEVKYLRNKQIQDEKKSKQDLLFMASMADKLAVEIKENQSGDIEELRHGMTELFKNLSVFLQMAANGESVYAIMEAMTSKIEKGLTGNNP